MAYTMEDIRKSQEIFYYLLEKHELREEDEQALYKAYTEEEDIQNIVKSQAETASCDIERYGNTIYLIPQEENNFLGYSRVELKKELCKSTATNKDYYLAQFVILTLLTEFFDGDGNSSRAREYIRSSELMNILSESLKISAFSSSRANICVMRSVCEREPPMRKSITRKKWILREFHFLICAMHMKR